MTSTRRLPRPFDLLLLWHGLFTGSYTIAYLSAESAGGLHQFAGYTALSLLALRLLAARLAAGRPPWALPWPKASMWQNFLRRLTRDGLAVFRGRTPLAPLSGLVLLGSVVLVALTGLSADWWGWEDLHEGPAELSLGVVLIHVAIVSFGPLLKRLEATRPIAQGDGA